MPVAFRSIDGTFTDGVQAVTVVAPSGIVNDDILIAIASHEHGGTTSITWPTGFTEFISQDHGTGAPFGGAAWKLAASESGNYTMTFVGGSNAMSEGIVVALSGGHTITPINASGADDANDSAGEFTAVCPDINTTADCLIIRAGGSRLGDGAFTNGGPTSTERRDANSGGSTNAHFLYTEDATVNGATNTATITYDGAVGFRGFVYTIAVAPAPSDAEGNIVIPDMRSINFYLYRGVPPATGRPGHK